VLLSLLLLLLLWLFSLITKQANTFYSKKCVLLNSKTDGTFSYYSLVLLRFVGKINMREREKRLENEGNKK
jgi:hypothetical protein